ncbi:MAG TPA: HAMP domain-containing sensor histidine kinase [Nitrososphaeraceae archaeon]|nr:HAMP domain-containing sensor histidine kinase [Nitrososphaeraceae archaeon]
MASQFASNAENRIDACTDYTRPSLIAEIRELKKAFRDAKRRGVKFRYVTEITAENVSFCKELLSSLVNELRHLDGIKGNFYVSEKEYIALAAFRENDKPLSHIIHSNMKEIVEEQQCIFDTLWNKSTPAEDKIKEIEQEMEPEYFRVINDNEEATKIFTELAKNAQYEILFLLPNDKALTTIDRLGIFNHLIDKCNKRIYGKGQNEFQAKIICPLSDANLNIVNRILQNTSPSNHIRIVNGNNSSFGIIIVDNKKFLKVELREPEAEQFSETIGLSFYSNSNPSVESYKLFFELLWNERTANEQFKLSDKMQREFINIAAHELRTPAQSVLGYAELMREDMMDKQDASRESINAIHRNAKRLQRLTNNILDVSRIESQTLNLDKEVFDLNDLLSKIVGDYENRTPKDDRNLNNKTRCALHLSYSRSRNNSSELIVEGDRDRINQAVSNLINNAIEFTSKKGGTISVTAEKRNVSSKDNQAEVIVNVVDSGEGIHHEIIPRLFTKFASRSNSGTGLGLYISKSIVEAHGGRIWAENNSDGIGAMFSFSLPISQNK